MAREYRLVWVDAFTSTPLQGNACAVVLDARGLDDAAMLAIARETNLSETAFVFPGDADCNFSVRYWMPVGEIPMAGHPTIATTHALFEAGLVAGAVLRLRMPAGVIPVTIRCGAATTTYAMSQLAPVFLDGAPTPEIAARALGLDESDILGEPGVVSTGTPQLMIALTSRAALDRVSVDRRVLFPPDRTYLSVHVFARGAGEAALVARHFADVGDVLEDPFTGSATGGMAGYCARYGIVAERRYIVHQGMHVHRPGRAEVEIAGDPPHDIGRITVAGPAVTVMHATLSV